MSLMGVFDIAGSGMSAQSLRLNTTASNMANANSAASSAEQTYRARDPVFMPVMNSAMQDAFAEPAHNAASTSVRVAGIVEDARPLQPRYEPGNPMANEEGYVFYPNVDIVEEMTNMISSSRAFQLNVDVMSAARTMMQRVLTLGQG
ncbi:MAG: flagellar basal body rod protein FlgC [Pseudohongiella sp.]